MSRVARGALLMASLATALGCESVTFSSPRLEALQAELNRQYGLWKTNPVGSYQYDFTRFCACGKDLQRPVMVEVVDSMVVAVTYADSGTAVPASAFVSYFAVEGLFGQIQAAINIVADSIVVDYDPILHYPTKVVVDQDRFGVNDELALYSTGLKAKP